MADSNPSTTSTPDDLPERLKEDLRQLYGLRGEVASSIDAAVLERARMNLARKPRRHPIAWTIAAGMALAACVAIVVTVRKATFHPVAQFARGDVDHNGRIDILDAFIVAKRLSEHAKPDADWDANGDGAIDQKDVEWIAAEAVRIAPTSPASEISVQGAAR